MEFNCLWFSDLSVAAQARGGLRITLHWEPLRRLAPSATLQSIKKKLYNGKFENVITQHQKNRLNEDAVNIKYKRW